ncbi:MAG: ATP-dependent DNA helicase [Gammaproteobacteria bacterium]|nr:ATP-dependent DNA helicase [Gammaproteobacteria bacterium]
MMEIADVLGPEGVLSRTLDGFAARSEQLAMSQAVADALDKGGRLIAEAGTGTGKTFAYLVPALLSGLKVIISTGTRNLQDQLFLRDLPRLREAMANPARVALLKGRANYLCIHRMENALLDARGHPAERLRWLLAVRDWSAQTRSGDISELSDVPEDASIWPLVTSTTDNCLGQECPAWSKCHLVEARRRAQEADIVVVNHHLLCADFALRDDGFGELLPGADAYVIDEAHQLPEVASSFFGTTVSSRQLLDLGRDTQTEYHREAGDVAGVTERIDALSKAARDLRLEFGQSTRRGAWGEIEQSPQVMAALGHCLTRLAELEVALEAIEGRGKGIDACLGRCTLLKRQLADLLEPDQEDDDIRWFETHAQSVRLNSTPLDVADVFQLHMQRHPAAWIFTSATLAVGQSFSHFQQQLGLADAETRIWDSPFDYQQQALWFVPRGLPAPNEAGYTAAVIDLAVPILAASGGRAFLLFTSHRALREAAGLLDEQLDFPLLVQGSAPKAELLEKFVEHGNAVLLATASFWEGVDVRGEALSLVIIDKLPFASPGDPVLQARLDAIRRRGGNPFMQYQVPQAAIALKQGAGRLIRDVSDRGVLVTCDPRMLKKGYGQVFLDAMPAFARTRDLDQVLAFFE